MFAVIKTGGKQYRVAANDQFTIERLPGETGDLVTFKEILMVGSTIGAPFIEGASVTAEIIGQTRGKKVISFKKRRRQNSKRTRGHRQDLTVVRVAEILTDGKTLVNVVNSFGGINRSLPENADVSPRTSPWHFSQLRSHLPYIFYPSY